MPFPSKTKKHLDLVHSVVQGQMFPVLQRKGNYLHVESNNVRLIPRKSDPLTLWFMMSALHNAIYQSKKEIGIRINIRFSHRIAKGLFVCILSNGFGVKDAYIEDYFIFNGELKLFRRYLKNNIEDVEKVINPVLQIVITRYYEELKKMEVENEVTDTNIYREFEVVWKQPKNAKVNKRKRTKRSKVSRSSRSNNNKNRKRRLDGSGVSKNSVRKAKH